MKILTAGRFISEVKKYKHDFDKHQLAYYRGKMKPGKHYDYVNQKLIVYYPQAIEDLIKYIENKEKGEI